MPGVARANDIGSGHGCWPSRPNSGWSGDVFVNGRGVHRQGDGWQVHCCPPIPECHASTLQAGSPDVITNGKQTGRCGDPVACGSTVATCSGNVFAD